VIAAFVQHLGRDAQHLAKRELLCKDSRGGGKRSRYIATMRGGISSGIIIKDQGARNTPGVTLTPARSAKKSGLEMTMGTESRKENITEVADPTSCLSDRDPLSRSMTFMTEGGAPHTSKSRCGPESHGVTLAHPLAGKKGLSAPIQVAARVETHRCERSPFLSILIMEVDRVLTDWRVLWQSSAAGDA